jgi:hypothetical protein
MAQKIKAMNKAMDSWVGCHKSDLIKQMGPPTRYESDGKDGEILIYEYSQGRQIPGTAYMGSDGNLHYTAPTMVNNQAYRMFYVNNKGIIYYWRWHGM